VKLPGDKQTERQTPAKHNLQLAKAVRNTDYCVTQPPNAQDSEFLTFIHRVSKA